MTYFENFESLKKKVLKVDKALLGKSFATQVNMTDPDGSGSFYIAHINGIFSVEPYDYCDHTSMVTTSARAFSDILTGKLDPVKAFISGDIDVEGDIGDLKTLSGAIKKPVRRAAAKGAESEVEHAKKTPPTRKKTPEKRTIES